MMRINVVKAHRDIKVFDTDAEEWEVTIPEPKPAVFRFPDDSEQD